MSIIDSTLYKEKVARTYGLTLFELDNGIGPIKEKMQLGPLDVAMASKGKKYLLKNVCLAIN